jgi:hypothetical protein
MRLFRQSTFGDWSTVFAQLASALQQHMAATAPQPPLAVPLYHFSNAELAVPSASESVG